VRTDRTFSVSSMLGLFIHCFAACTNAHAIPVPLLTTDNRIVSSTGNGQVQGYNGSWDQSAVPLPSYSTFDTYMDPGVDFESLPAPPHESSYFLLITDVEQNSSVTPAMFTGSGVAGMGTGVENSNLEAAAEMHVQSLFDVEFSLTESYMANLIATLSLLPAYTFSDGTANGQAFISLMNNVTMTPIFSYSYDYTDGIILNQEIVDAALLGPGSYEFLVGVSNDISYVGYADFGYNHTQGWGNYDFRMNLTRVPEPASLALMGLGLVLLAYLNKPKWSLIASLYKHC
jgi:hypothetical protein